MKIDHNIGWNANWTGTRIVPAGRSDLLQFLQSECEDTGATIVYATHIFDGLESWPTHLMYLANGTLKVSAVYCLPFFIALMDLMR